MEELVRVSEGMEATQATSVLCSPDTAALCGLSQLLTPGGQAALPGTSPPTSVQHIEEKVPAQTSQNPFCGPAF